MNTHTFTSVDNVFKVTVKSDFLKKCAEPEKIPMHELLTEHQMGSFLHNTKGPALEELRGEHLSEYFLDGKVCTPEEVEKIKQEIGFNNTVTELLNQE